MKKNLLVFTTSRKVREFYANLSDSLVINEAITLENFLSKVVYVENLAMANEYQSFVIMQKASQKVANLTDKLGINPNFLVFLKNKEYLFGFYKELKRERVCISKLNQNDTYLDYQEHLLILENLLQIYEKDLLENGLYDDITLPGFFKLNTDYIEQFEKINIKIDGILTKFDFEVLSLISQKTELILNFKLNKFNKKLKTQIENITNLELELDYEYEISLSHFEILSKNQVVKLKNQIKFREFSQRNLQIPFIFDEISNFIRQGLDPKKIALILPDEEFSQIIRLFDENKMLNYAMGESFSSTKSFQILTNIKNSLNNPIFSSDYLEKSQNIVPSNALLNYFCIDENSFFKVLQNYEEICDFESFCELVFGLLGELELDEKQILQNELFLLKPIFKFKLKFYEILELLILGLSRAKFSLVGGGEVGVYGLLESRSMEFDGVVIVDFNENLVPKRGHKELFLNSKVRQNSGLISHNDRENLQRFYYENLISNAKFASLSCVKDDENMPCVFLHDFEYFVDETFSQKAYINAIASSNFDINLQIDEVVLKHNFFEKPLSFSRLNTFLNCKRQYYYRYILEIFPPREFGDELNLAHKGTIIHKIFEDYFSLYKTKFDKDEFLKIAIPNLESFDPLTKEIFLINIPKIAKSHKAWFDSGFSVKNCEIKLEKKIGNVVLQGILDRIDINGDKIVAIDYKSGNINEKSLQLAFYEILSDANEAYYFDLKTSFDFKKNQVEKDEVFSVFDEIKALGEEINFEQNLSNCEYCPYVLMCKKELF